MKIKKPLLTISLLISNRPDTIPRCLDSLKPIMEAIPSELVLIDTSKSEDIHNLLLTYTDKVYEFEWCNDFAKARNEGVRRANGEWFLYIDDDEWFVDVQDILSFFQTGKYKKYEYAHIIVRNYTDVNYTLYSDAWCTRLFYIGGGAVFKGKVHEHVQGVHGKPMFLQSKIHHSGYVYDSEEKRLAHFERNKALLVEALKEDPNDLRLIAHLVQEYRSIKDWDAMVSICKEQLKKKWNFQINSDVNHFCTLYAGLVEALTFLKQNEKALEICEIGLEDERSTDLLKYVLHLYSAMNYTEMKVWDKANEHVCQYFDGYQHFQKNMDAMNVQLGAVLIHRVFDNSYMSSASNMLLYSTLKRENIEVPFAIAGEDVKTEMDVQDVLKFIRKMLSLIVSTRYKDIFTDFLNHTVQNLQICKLMCAEVSKLEKNDEEAFQKIAYELAKTESTFWYIGYCRVVEADSRGDKKDVENTIEALLKELSVVCHMPDCVYEIVDKYDIKIALLWDKVVGDRWPEHANKLVNHCEDVYIDKAYDYLLDVYEESDWRVVEFLSAFQEKVNREQRRGEMNALRAQVLEQVKALKEAGQEQEAEQIMEQLKTMFPGDEEVMALETELRTQMLK